MIKIILILSHRDRDAVNVTSRNFDFVVECLVPVL